MISILTFIINIGISFGKGICLGSSICFIGYVMDNTISNKTHEIVIKTKPELFLQAQQYILKNLLCIIPIMYVFVNICLTNKPFCISEYVSIIIIHNIGYFLIHREMHRNLFLFKIHKFHHLFDTIVIPSVSNAVSYEEFLLSLVLPFSCVAFIIRPSEISFICAIETISILHMLMHTNELDNIKWIPGMVAPSLHIEHHRNKKKHYSSGLFDLDIIFNMKINFFRPFYS